MPSIIHKCLHAYLSNISDTNIYFQKMIAEETDWKLLQFMVLLHHSI